MPLTDWYLNLYLYMYIFYNYLSYANPATYMFK